MSNVVVFPNTGNNLGNIRAGILDESALVEGIFRDCFSRCQASYISDFYLNGMNTGLKKRQEHFI